MKREQAVIALFLGGLFPDWEITVERGVWRADGRVLVRSSSADGLVEGLYAADPDAVQRAAGLFLSGQ